MKRVIDNFSSGAADYATFRPEFPSEVFDFLYKHVKCFDTAWDCGTGNGQVAIKLSERFRSVYGSDISMEQLSNAPKRNNVIYRQERSEQTLFPDRCIDLITVAQAIHWFDFDMFYNEVRRVAKKGALIAAWTYANIQSTPSMNQVFKRLYWDITRPYWDKERDYVDASYKTIPFPFEEIAVPSFSIVQHVNKEQLTGYLRTWSGVKHYISQQQKDPISMIEGDLEKAWGDADTIEVHWPVYLRAGFVK